MAGRVFDAATLHELAIARDAIATLLKAARSVTPPALGGATALYELIARLNAHITLKTEAGENA